MADMIPAETLGERVLRLRRAAKLTLRQMAAATGRQPATIMDIEQDRSDPRLSTLRSVAQALGTSVPELLEGVRQP